MVTLSKPEWTELQLKSILTQWENTNTDESWEEYSQKRWVDYNENECELSTIL